MSGVSFAGWAYSRTVGAPDSAFDAHPESRRLHDEVLRAAWAMTDASLLALCSLRMSQELACRLAPAPAGIDPDELERWRESTAYTPRERAALAYAEMFLVDAHGVEGALTADLSAHLSRRELLDFVAALHAVEAYLRACALLGAASDVCAFRAGDGRPAGRAAGDDLPPEPPLEDGDARRVYRLVHTDARYREARQAFVRSVVRIEGADDLTTEAVRLRNAAFQQCRH
jgi:hypothetical protein